jgi:hypothetical protein
MRFEPRIALATCLIITTLIFMSCGGARFEQKNNWNGNNNGQGGGGNGGGGGGGNNKPDKERIFEHFVQDHGAHKVDILVISDDSYSMEADQKKLGAKFSSFISELATIDWHVGVTTTDLISENALKGRLDEFQPGQIVLTPETANAQKLFEKTVVRKCHGMVCGSSDEQPLGATVAAVNLAEGANHGFFRDGVDLAVLAISDEDEMSTGGSKATKPEKVIQTIQDKWGSTKKFSAYGIIIKPGDTKCLIEQGGTEVPRVKASAYYGRYVDKLSKMTGGETYSICEKDYDPLLKDISNKIRKLVYSFQLQATPELDTLTVQLTPNAEIGYHVEHTRLVFDQPPAAGTQISVSYIPAD